MKVYDFMLSVSPIIDLQEEFLSTPNAIVNEPPRRLSIAERQLLSNALICSSISALRVLPAMIGNLSVEDRAAKKAVTVAHDAVCKASELLMKSFSTEAQRAMRDGDSGQWDRTPVDV